MMGMYTKKYVDGVDCQSADDGMTKQSFKKESDINDIVARYAVTGEFPVLNPRSPVYCDVSEIKSYQESLDVVIKAEAMFDALPSRIRERFDNDPVKMVAFLGDSRNLDEAVELGMAVKRPDASVSPKVGVGGVSAPAVDAKSVPGADGAPKAS